MHIVIYTFILSTLEIYIPVARQSRIPINSLEKGIEIGFNDPWGFILEYRTTMNTTVEKSPQ